MSHSFRIAVPRQRLRSLHRPRRGVTVVEFATVAPLAFFFFFVAFEFCRVAMVRHTADNAVYEAARRGVVPGATADDARGEAQRVLGTVGIDHFTIQIEPETIEAESPEVTVRVRVPLDDNSFVPTQFLGGRFIERELTLRREGS